MFAKKSILILFVYAKYFGACVSNNACKSLDDYRDLETNPNCWFDADVNASPVSVSQFFFS